MCHLLFVKSFEFSCFIFCYVHLMKEYFLYHCEEICGRCLMFWSVLWFWLFWSHYFSWILFFLNSSPLQYGISFNYKLTRTSWWGPLWENNRLLPTSPPKKSDPPPPAVGNKHWITLKIKTHSSSHLKNANSFVASHNKHW